MREPPVTITSSTAPADNPDSKDLNISMSDPLKLMALDADDLLVISAHVQDSTLRSCEIEYSPSKNLLILPVNRFAWEAPATRRLLRKKYQRRRSVLHFSQVTGLQSSGVDRNDESQVNALLSISFLPTEDENDPGGQIKLDFGGGGGLLLNVECIEAQLTDLGAAWEASSKPQHNL